MNNIILLYKDFLRTRASLQPSQRKKWQLVERRRTDGGENRGT